MHICMAGLDNCLTKIPVSTFIPPVDFKVCKVDKVQQWVTEIFYIIPQFVWSWLTFKYDCALWMPIFVFAIVVRYARKNVMIKYLIVHDLFVCAELINLEDLVWHSTSSSYSWYACNIMQNMHVKSYLGQMVGLIKSHGQVLNEQDGHKNESLYSSILSFTPVG